MDSNIHEIHYLACDFLFKIMRGGHFQFLGAKHLYLNDFLSSEKGEIRIVSIDEGK
jgi:hypothetical protein